MSISLAEALRQVQLEPGCTYRCQVNDIWVELHVLETRPSEAASSIPERDIMLDAWCSLPPPPAAGYAVSRLGTPRTPYVPPIPTDEDDQ